MIVRRRIRCAALAGLAMLLVAVRVQANIFVADGRAQRDPTLPIFRSVGLLHHPESSGGGTAFLVGRCHVVTAWHVAFMKERDPVTGEVRTLGPKLGHTAEFLAGPDREAAGNFRDRTQATVVAFGRFSGADFDGMAGDWAILRLKDCLGDKYGFLRYTRPGRADPMPTGELMTVGFPRSRAAQAGIAVERGCKARDHGPVAGLVGIDCAFESGMSGGPVLERQPQRGWVVVGLIQQSMAEVDGVLPAYSMAHRNQMLSVSAFGKALDAALRSESRRALDRRAR